MLLSSWQAMACWQPSPSTRRADELACRLVLALRRRGWDGDDDLAD
jgi:hypothetical protein